MYSLRRYFGTSALSPWIMERSRSGTNTSLPLCFFVAATCSASSMRFRNSAFI